MFRTLAVICVISSGVSAQAGISAIERQRLLAHLDMTSRWFMDEVTGLTPAQLAFKRSADEWSIAQVIDHLLVVGPIYWADLQVALKAPPRREATTNTDADLLWYGIDRTNRERAIPTEVPMGKFRDLASALAEYRKSHDRLRQYVRTTADDLRAHYVARQGSDAYQWLLLISTHEQRHILQIRELKSADGFPKR